MNAILDISRQQITDHLQEIAARQDIVFADLEEGIHRTCFSWFCKLKARKTTKRRFQWKLVA